MEILLASKSPRRRELLSQIGVRYKVVDVDVPEEHQRGESPEAYVQRLAISKARAGLKGNPERVVMGSDTVVCCDDVILEKPRDAADFREMLTLLSGRRHEVKTGVALCKAGREIVDCSTSEVTFRELTPDEIDQYWLTAEPKDKAGGYGVQGMGAVFVTEIVGSYSGIVGLPIEKVFPMLQQFSVPIWRD